MSGNRRESVVRLYFNSGSRSVWVTVRSMSAPSALRSVQLVHDYREDASVKATGKWKATLATLAIASSVALATEASATGVSNSNEGNANIDQHSATETHQGSI